MNRFFKLFLGLLVLVIFACSDYVKDVDDRIDLVEDAKLTSEAQTDFVVTGVYGRFASTVDGQLALAELLSDAFFYSNDVKGASFPSYEEIDKGEIELDNNSVDGIFNALGQLRYYADTLVDRASQIEFKDENNKNKAFFAGYFFGGVARYFYAIYWGLSEHQGGGVINEGPFIPSDEMIELAIDKLTESLDYADDYQKKVVNTLLARIYLVVKGDYSKAKEYADKGLMEGDAPFQSLYTSESSNYWWGYAGPGRCQFVASDRFKQYIDTDPAEANRIKLAPIPSNSDANKVYYRQDMYQLEGSPLTFLDWQENALMLAEIALHNGDNNTALEYVNKVRASHSLSDLSSIDQDVLIAERDKELFTRGLRLLDQKRFGLWHLASDKWEFLPITRSERNKNKNID